MQLIIETNTLIRCFVSSFYTFPFNKHNMYRYLQIKKTNQDELIKTRIIYIQQTCAH